MLEIDPELYRHAPFFQVRACETQLVTRGVETCRLGHQIESSSDSGPDGVFAEWEWDGTQLHVRTDRFGMYPLFYAVSEKSIAISTSCFKLIESGAPPAIDWAALAVFLRIGFFVGEDTVFSSIRIMPPAGRLTWERGCFRVADQPRITPSSGMSYDAAADAYVDLFREAIRRRLAEQDHVALPLSGGRDSRHILYELCDQGAPPSFCITGRRFPPDQRDDERIAEALATELGIRHIVVGPPEREVESLIAANVKTNMTAPRRGWKMAIIARLEAELTQCSYDGIGGDMLSGGSALTEKRVELFEKHQYEQFARHVFGRAEQRLAAVLPDHAYRRITDDIAIERLVPELERHEAAANPTTSFYFWNRTRRFDSTNPYGMLLDVPVVYSPFLDHELVDMLLSLPSQTVFSGQLHDDVILRAYPQYSHIPFEREHHGNKRDPRRMRATTNALIGMLAGRHPTHLLRKRFTIPRLGARFSSLGYGAVGSWWLSLITFLTVLDVVAYQGAVAQVSDQGWKTGVDGPRNSP